MSHLSRKKKATNRLFGIGTFAILMGLVFALPGFGQSPEEHAKHHPNGNDSAMPAAGNDAGKDGAGAMGGDMEGMMDGMMKKMGVPPPKDIYPSLMSLPELTPERREEILGLAQNRMSSSVALLSEGLDRLGEAAEDEDYATMQEATAEVREALARFESGLAARRALAEGKPPRQVALQWFKSEMNLQPPQGIEASGGLVGITLFHILTMVLLIAFALAMVAMYFFKMRRAAALFERIEGDAGSPPPGSAPPLAAPPLADKNRQLEVTQT